MDWRSFPSFLPTRSQLLTISLTNYLILSGLTDSRKMDEQEYLDREDHFVSIQRNTHCTPWSLIFYGIIISSNQLTLWSK